MPSDEIAILRLELQGANDKNFRLLRDIGAINRAVTGWIERTNPALWNSVRQRLTLGESLIEMLEHIGADRAGRAVYGAETDRLIESLRVISPEMAASLEFELSEGKSANEVLADWQRTITHKPAEPTVNLTGNTKTELDAEDSSPTRIAQNPASRAFAPPDPNRRKRPTRVVAATGSSITLTEPMFSFTEWERAVIIAIGSGQFLDGHAAEALPAELKNTGEENCARRLSEALSGLSEGGFIQITDLDLGVSREALHVCEGQRAIRLTPSGEAGYLQIADQPAKIVEVTLPSPMRVPEGWGRAIECYDSLESYVFVRAAKTAIGIAAQRHTERYPPQWNVRVFDMMDRADVRKLAADEEYAKTLEKSGRSFQTRWRSADGAEAVPDLIVLMRPVAGGIPTIMLVEVERGKYSKQNMIEKLRRNILCYPPYPFCYIFPTNTMAGQMFSLFKENVVEPEIRMHGLPSGGKAMFTDLRKVALGSWWSIEQASKAAIAKKMHKDKGANADYMPYFWAQSPAEKPFAKERHATNA